MACDHESCRCTDSAVEVAGKSYCSEACAERAVSGGDTGQPCDCGHPACSSR